MSSALKVGITGGIGSGKTTVAKIFNLLGVAVYDADSEAKNLMETDDMLIYSIIEEFGQASYNSGKLDRQYLAKTVFIDEAKLKKLNSLVHPAVGRNFEIWAARSTEPYVLKEAALLFETNSYKDLDYTILVTSPLSVRAERIRKRDPQRSEEQIRAIIAKQISVDKAEMLADCIIMNDEENLLIPQVLESHNYLMKKG